MAHHVDAAKCVGCAYCVDVCPAGAVRLNDAMIATIAEDLCADCGLCACECPGLAVMSEEEYAAAATH